MTAEEEIRLEEQIAVLKEVALEYSGKTIDNIIQQMEARVKLEKDELPIEDIEEYRLKNKQNEPKSHYYYYVAATSDNHLCGCAESAEERFPLASVREFLAKTCSLDKDKIGFLFFAEISKEQFDLYDKHN